MPHMFVRADLGIGCAGSGLGVLVLLLLVGEEMGYDDGGCGIDMGLGRHVFDELLTDLQYTTLW